MMKSPENIITGKEAGCSTYDPKIEEELSPAFAILDAGCRTELSYLLTKYNIREEERGNLRGDPQPQLRALRKYCSLPEKERDAKTLGAFMEEDLAQWERERATHEHKMEI